MSKYKIIGIILILIFLFNIPNILKKNEVYNKGYWVDVIVTNKTTGGGSLTSYWLDFRFNNQEYYKKVGVAYYNEITIGDTLKLKYLPNNEIFLMSTEKPMTVLYLLLPLLLIGLFLILYPFKKSKYKTTKPAH
jgi:hypothetical protein